MALSLLEQNVHDFYMDKHYSCSETLLLACDKTYQLHLPDGSMKLLSGFSGGMYTGNLCGALSGCTAALSAMLVQTCAHETKILPQAERLLVSNFRKQLGHTQCPQIKMVHHSPETRCLNTCLLAAKAMNQTVLDLINDGLYEPQFDLSLLQDQQPSLF